MNCCTQGDGVNCLWCSIDHQSQSDSITYWTADNVLHLMPILEPMRLPWYCWMVRQLFASAADHFDYCCSSGSAYFRNSAIGHFPLDIPQYLPWTFPQGQ